MSKLFDLTGRVALVTGGNSGIGLGMATALAEAGANVAIWGTNAAKNEAARDTLETTGRRVLALRVLGHADACFANAGISGGRSGPFLDRTLEDFERVLRVNLTGAFLTFRAAARHMAERGQGGSLVGTASLAAVEGAARNEHYGASKGGMCAMVRALAVELARYRIRANAILPGWIETDMTARSVADARFSASVMPRIPARRWGDGADFGGVAVYLASAASAYHTGDSLLVDGGYSKF